MAKSRVVKLELDRRAVSDVILKGNKNVLKSINDEIIDDIERQMKGNYKHLEVEVEYQQGKNRNFFTSKVMPFGHVDFKSGLIPHAHIRALDVIKTKIKQIARKNRR